MVSILKRDFGFLGLNSGALCIQPKIPEISVGTSKGTDHFGLVRPEYSRLALKEIHFDRSGHFGLKCPFSFDKIVVPSTALLYPAYKNNHQTRGGLGQVCATRMYRSTGQVKFLKFQTGIFVEWKALNPGFHRQMFPGFWNLDNLTRSKYLGPPTPFLSQHFSLS